MRLICLAILLFLVHLVSAACTSLTIDTFASPSQYDAKNNSLGYYTFDDGTMQSVSVSGGQLSLTPRTTPSYWFSGTGCMDVTGYTSISFNVVGPSGSDFVVELQSRASCSSTFYASSFIAISNLGTTLTGNSQQITIPLSKFSGANLNYISNIVFETFSVTGKPYVFGPISFSCSALPTPPTGPTNQTSPPPPNVPTPIPVPTTPASPKFLTSPTPPTPTIVTGIPGIPKTASSGCQDLLIDDYYSQSRLTFLGYNALQPPGPSSDDGSMDKIVVEKNSAALYPKDSTSYFYTELNCLNVKQVGYSGIRINIAAPVGSSFILELQSTANALGKGQKCNADTFSSTYLDTNMDLGWKFNGKMQTFLIPFQKFPNAPLANVQTILMESFSKYKTPFTLGPIWLYCPGSPTSKGIPSIPTSTYTPQNPGGPGHISKSNPLVIDTFGSEGRNDLGHYHGVDGATAKISSKSLVFKSDSTDAAFYSLLSDGCFDLTKYEDAYLHISGKLNPNQDFSIAIQQTNAQCNSDVFPFPETWDEVQATHYQFGEHDFYVPINHFKINFKQGVAIALRAFTTNQQVKFTKIEIVPSTPKGYTIPPLIQTVPLIFGCKVPNTFAFAMDDGDPQYAQTVFQAVKKAGFPVTLFTVGEALNDPTTNFTNLYKDGLKHGYQVAMHSFTHPDMVSLNPSQMDWEFSQDQLSMFNNLGIKSKYFRPPFGSVDARMRQRAAAAGIKAFIMWSVDIRDWQYPDDGKKMLAGFKADIASGGTISVAHFLTKASVDTFPEFLAAAKATGKKMVTVEQCVGDARI